MEEKFEKPMTKNQKELGNKLYQYMYGKRTVTKEAMFKFLGWGTNKDRQLRDLISCIAKKVPIVSTSDKRGYYVATTIADYGGVEHTCNELKSRIRELEKRLAPLEAFKAKCEKYLQNVQEKNK